MLQTYSFINCIFYYVGRYMIYMICTEVQVPWRHWLHPLEVQAAESLRMYVLGTELGPLEEQKMLIC